MFEILLLIYLFPIMVIAMLLVKLAIWIVRNLFKSYGSSGRCLSF